ncbi:hypothetical protein KC19_VG067100 [Ceratodon purpureus]|uniref:Uncharacterized protein n=1 Tax=Ceratodon purpureus TaxID=3225 RepID=A0A8T0HMP6_CERPU|nr:hypothetical protein KC19_VG067100 [Ceratodon purpureus]
MKRNALDHYLLLMLSLSLTSDTQPNVNASFEIKCYHSPPPPTSS